ncbi:MAG: PAS domain S-box protein [Ideonella sp.]
MEQHDGLRETLRSEARYRLLVDAVVDYAIYMLDPTGFIVSWNSGAQRLKGYSEQEVIGQHFSRFYTEEDRHAGLPDRALHRSAEEGRFEAEGWRVKKGGQRFWAHVVIDPILAPDHTLLGFAKVTRDLTERRAADDSLRRSEQQLRLLIQGVTDYALYMLSPDGIVTNWNAGAQRIKGYQPAEVIGTNFSRFYRDEDQAAGHPAKALATAAAEGRFESEGWRVRKDGTQFWANAIVDPIRDEAGNILGFAKITRDMTEKRDAQLALERAREELFQAQKLDAIGQLTGGVAHDFNNLLAVVLNSLELLRRRVPRDENTDRLIDNAVRGVERGVLLTRRMLAFARRQELAPVAVHLNALVRGMHDLLESSLGLAIRLELAIADNLQRVMVDPNQLELALLNLAINARDAMPQGGRLTISAREESASANATTRMAAGNYVVLSMADSGSGMSEQTLAHAMEPFFTTKGPGKGTGLGLPMVHGLAAQSGGQFRLLSTEGVGTTAELWLPAAPVNLANALKPTPSAPADGAHNSSLVVIAIDDDALVLAGTVAMLEDLGHKVLAATSGEQALELLHTESEVAMVITDQVMPRMTGSQLIARLRLERPDIPVILATGFAGLVEVSTDAAARLSKPFDLQQLAAAIRHALRSAATR